MLDDPRAGCELCTMPAVSRKQLLLEGVPRGAIERRRVRENLKAAFPGYYACDDEWQSMLEAHLLRGGEHAAASHRAAGRLHRLDGLTEFTGFDFTVPLDSTLRRRPAFRSGTLQCTDTVFVHELRATTIERTLIDLGRVLPTDGVELAMEAALRGPDPKRPEEWNEGLLISIAHRLDGCRSPGSGALREVLARRPIGARPTGSYAETRALQALRRRGHGGLLRQPTVSLADNQLERYGTWYPDLYDPSSGVAFEVDGAIAHAAVDQRRRDATRDNVLGEYLRVVRIVATDVVTVAGADAFAVDAARAMGYRRRSGWQGANVDIRVEGNNVSIRRR